MSIRSLPFRVCVYFACAPDEELTSADIMQKFDMLELRHVNQQLRAVSDAGYLARKQVEKGPGSYIIYSAGPLLLRMLGRSAK